VADPLVCRCLTPPCVCFHTPLIEPDVRICRIRLSEKTHAIAVAIACDAAGLMETCSLIRFHQLRPSPKSGRVGSCISRFEACSAFTHVTACMLAESL
jgi:hypothetical protein